MTQTSDNGLIAAYLLDGEGGGTRLNWAQLGQSIPEQATEWVHLDREYPEVQTWLRESSGLPGLVAESLLAESTRPHCSRVDDGVMLFLRAVNMNPGAMPDDMLTIRLWVERKRIITLRKRRLLSEDDLLTALELGEGPRNSAEFIASMVSAISDRISEVMDEVDDSVDGLEEQVLEVGGSVMRNQLTDARRQIIALRRYLSPQRDALNRLTQLQLKWLAEQDQQHLREEVDRVTHFVEGLDAARDRAKVTQEELSNRISEQISSRMYVLSVVAAIFLPLGFIAGLFGVNVGGMPMVGTSWGFAALSAALAVIAVVQLLVFRWKGWLGDGPDKRSRK